MSEIRCLCGHGESCSECAPGAWERRREVDELKEENKRLKKLVNSLRKQLKKPKNIPSTPEACWYASRYPYK